MYKLNGKVTDECNFFQGNSAFDIVEKYGTPLYLYNERILRERCRELKNLVKYKNFTVNYSAKANSSLAILQIVRSEGLNVDALSSGEIYFNLAAGFKPSQILFIANNVSTEEMQYAVSKNVLVSVDSISQLERLGKINRGGEVCIRFNPGVGTGHHEKVITGGKTSKFGVNPEYISEVNSILEKYDMKLVGINQHIGSLFMEDSVYVAGFKSITEIAKNFGDLRFIDIGGGFGIPYSKQKGQGRLDLKLLGEQLDGLIHKFVSEYGKEIEIKIEPGRYIPAESGILLGMAHTVKYNGDLKFVGTDIGMNVLMRPALYDSHHEIEVYRKDNNNSGKEEPVSIVGNICESSDFLVKNEMLPEIMEEDIIAVLDAGAYGLVMASNYNNRLRPAEVMIREDNSVVLIRERDNLEDLMKPYKSI